MRNPVDRFGKRPPHPVLLPKGRRDARTATSLERRAAAYSLSPWGEGWGEGGFCGRYAKRSTGFGVTLFPDALQGLAQKKSLGLGMRALTNRASRVRPYYS